MAPRKIRWKLPIATFRFRGHDEALNEYAAAEESSGWSLRLSGPASGSTCPRGRSRAAAQGPKFRPPRISVWPGLYRIRAHATALLHAPSTRTAAGHRSPSELQCSPAEPQCSPAMRDAPTAVLNGSTPPSERLDTAGPCAPPTADASAIAVRAAEHLVAPGVRVQRRPRALRGHEQARHGRRWPRLQLET